MSTFRIYLYFLNTRSRPGRRRDAPKATCGALSRRDRHRRHAAKRRATLLISATRAGRRPSGASWLHRRRRARHRKARPLRCRNRLPQKFRLPPSGEDREYPRPRPAVVVSGGECAQLRFRLSLLSPRSRGEEAVLHFPGPVSCRNFASLRL